MTSVSRWTPVVAAGLMACSSGDAGEADVAMAEDGAVVLEAVVGGGPVSDSVPPVALWRSRSLTPWGGGLAIVDNGNDRVVVVDRALRVQRTVGRSGAGPGEFEQPVTAQAADGALVVAEMGNRRFTEIDGNGDVLRVWPAPFVGLLSLGIDAAGRIYVPSRRPADYLVRLSGDSAEPFGARPDTAVVDTMRPVVGPPDPLVAVTAGDTVHVFDNLEGVLNKFAPDGRLALRRRLPSPFLDSLIARRDATIGAFGGDPRGVSVPLIKDLSTTTDGALLLLVTKDRAGGLLIDPRTYRVRRIVVPDDGPQWIWLLQATDAVFDDPLLYVLAADSLVVYRTGSGR